MTDMAWIAEHPARQELWLDAYTSGIDAGAASRPTDEEIQRCIAEAVERAYADGYRDGLAVDQHRQDAKILTSLAVIALNRQRPGSSYIPREAVA